MHSSGSSILNSCCIRVLTCSMAGSIVHLGCSPLNGCSSQRYPELLLVCAWQLWCVYLYTSSPACSNKLTACHSYGSVRESNNILLSQVTLWPYASNSGSSIKATREKETTMGRTDDHKRRSMQDWHKILRNKETDSRGTQCHSTHLHSHFF